MIVNFRATLLILIFAGTQNCRSIPSNNVEQGSASHPPTTLLVRRKSKKSDLPKEKTTLREKCLKFVTDSLGSDRVNTRIEALRMLGIIGDTGKIGLIKKHHLLNDLKDNIKIESAVALNKLGDKSGVRQIIKIMKNKPKLPPKPKLIDRARALAKGTVRVRATKILGEMGNRLHLQILKEMSKDDDGRVVDAALISLAKLGDRSGVEIFISGLNSSDKHIRAKACNALGEIKEKSSAGKLRQLLKYWDKEVRAEACLALGKIGDEKSGPFIRELLEDKEETVRMKACESLGLLGDKRFVPQLKERLKDENGFVRLYAAEALARLGDYLSVEQFLLGTLNRVIEPDVRLKTIQILRDFIQKGSVSGQRDVLSALVQIFDTEYNIIVKLNTAGAVVYIIDKSKKKGATEK